MLAERKKSDYLCLILLYKQFNFTALESERGRVLSHLKMPYVPRETLLFQRSPVWVGLRKDSCPPAHHGGLARVDGEKRPKKNNVVSVSQGILWSARGSLGSCPSQKPAPGHHHRDPAGNSVLHPHERVLLHCNDGDRAPAVTGSGCGECLGLCRKVLYTHRGGGQQSSRRGGSVTRLGPHQSRQQGGPFRSPSTPAAWAQAQNGLGLGF